MDHDTQPIYQTRVKICGLTNLDDALVATEAGADLLGFIFYEKSPRNVTPRQVRDIIDQLGVAGNRLPSTVHRSPLLVGVFVNPSLEQVTRTLDYCGLDLAQLHGEEAPELLAALPGRAFKALRPKDAAEAASQAGQFARFGPAGGPDLLVDAYHPTLRGGGGQTGDWSLAAGLAAQHRLLLAVPGGRAGGAASPAAGRRPDARQRRRGHCPGAALGRGRGQRRRSHTRPQRPQPRARLPRRVRR